MKKHEEIKAPLQNIIDLMRFSHSIDSCESNEHAYFMYAKNDEGGKVIMNLKELSDSKPKLIKETFTKNLGKFECFGEKVKGIPYCYVNKTVRIFENTQFKFICIEDIEVNPSTHDDPFYKDYGWGEVQLYLNPKRIERECPMCGITFIAKPSNKEVCSSRCRKRKSDRNRALDKGKLENL
jgi:hypothetical protein